MPSIISATTGASWCSYKLANQTAAAASHYPPRELRWSPQDGFGECLPPEQPANRSESDTEDQPQRGGMFCDLIRTDDRVEPVMVHGAPQVGTLEPTFNMDSHRDH